MLLFAFLFACSSALQPVPTQEVRWSDLGSTPNCLDCEPDPLAAPKSCDQPDGTEPNDGNELGIPVDDDFFAVFSLQDEDVDTFVVDLPPHTRMELEVRFERDHGNVDLGLFVGPVEVDVVTGQDGNDSAVFSNVGDGWMQVAVDAYLSGGEGCVMYDVEVGFRRI